MNCTPSELMELAKCMVGFQATTQESIEVYLLCQIAGPLSEQKVLGTESGDILGTEDGMMIGVE